MVPRHDIILNIAHNYVVTQLLKQIFHSTNEAVSRNVNEAALFINVKFSCSLTLPVLQYTIILLAICGANMANKCK